jgi:hypothetical protein
MIQILNLLFIIGVIGAFVSAIMFIVRVFKRVWAQPPLIALGAFLLLALATLAIARFGGAYDEDYAIYSTYTYSLALDKFKNKTSNYPPDLDTLFVKGYIDKKLSGLRCATSPNAADNSYYFVYKPQGDNFTLYAKSLKMKPTFFVDQTGSIRLNDAYGKIVTIPAQQTPNKTSSSIYDSTHKQPRGF